MKLGCCLNMLGSAADPIGQEYIAVLAHNGYDYLELPLAQIMDLTDTEFENLLERLKESGVPCECCNNFFPASVRLTGENVNPEDVELYVKKAMKRAVKLGVKVIVFGSSGAKNVPEGFDHSRAFLQITDTLRMVHNYAAEAGICIAIEPLNREESNIIRNLSEGKALMEAVNRPTVRLLADYYHFVMEKETLKELHKAIDSIVHVHFANPDGRVIPTEASPNYEVFFDELKAGGYCGRVSVEAYAANPEEAIKKAVLLRQYF